MRIVTWIFLLVFLIYENNCQDYSDIEDQLLQEILQEVKLRKCHCNGNQYYVNNTCHETDTIVPILPFQDVIESIAVNTSYFDIIPNAQIRCSFPKHLTRINPRDLFILTTGELIHVPTKTSYSPLEFCIDHVTGDGQIIEWEVHLCLPQIIVPVCCQYKKNTKNYYKYCNHPNLPVGFGFSSLKGVVINTKPANKFECDVNESVTEAVLSDPTNPSSSVYLNYEENSIELLVFSSSGHNVPPKHLLADKFCIVPKTTNTETTYMASFCARDAVLEHQLHCDNYTCVRKCCPYDQLYSTAEETCIFSSEYALWAPIFENQNDSSSLNIPDNIRISFGLPICKRSYYALNTAQMEEDHILSINGSVYVPEQNISISSPRYCMDNFISSSNKISQNTLICFPDQPPEQNSCSQIKAHVYPILLIISCVFLLITIIVYASIPELHAKLHGKSLLSHVTALFVAYFSLAIVQWMTSKMTMTFCRCIAFIIQISFLSSFFWLNVMCFDIWWTLRSMRPVAETSENFRRRFVYYSIYAWGCPLIISSVTITMETLFTSSQMANKFILPGFGRKNCWFHDNASLWVYFYSFVSVLTITNIIFFLCVATILIQAQRANNGILRTTTKQNKERVWIYLKLFIVMGITWICEVASYEEGSCHYWIFTDIINTLQGFFIFLIFICKKKIFMKLQKRSAVSTRKLKRFVQGSSSYGSSSHVTQQMSLESSRKLSTSLHYHLSKLNKLNNPIGEVDEPKK